MIFLTDKEIAEELGLSFEKWQSVSAILEKKGLPRRDALFEDRRCWPAVLEFFVKRANGTGPTTLAVTEGGKDEKTFRESNAAWTKTAKEPRRKPAVVLDLQRARRDIGLLSKDRPGS